MTPTPENAPPGTEIVCIKKLGRSGLGLRWPLRVGDIYTVNEWDFDGDIAVSEYLRAPDGIECGFPARAFRLLHPAASPELYTVKAPVDAELVQ